jgi:cell division protein FtsW (lipid II flippase)
VTLPALPDLSALPDLNTVPELRRLPHWLGPALLALALSITLAGRHGLRLMNGALLGMGWFCAALFGLHGVLHPWLPGVAAILLGAIGLLIGLVQPSSGTGLVLAAICAPCGFLAARQFKLFWQVPTAAAAILGFFFGLSNHKRLSIVLPPLFAALFAASGAQLLWRPRYPLSTKLAATAALEVALVVLALERARRAQRRAQSAESFKLSK